MDLIAAEAAPGLSHDTLSLWELVAQITLEDIGDVQFSQKGKAKAGTLLSDLEFALRLQEEEVESLSGLTRDYKLAQSLQHALVTDFRILQEFEETEAASRRDREAAFALSEGRPLPPQQYPSATMPVERPARSISEMWMRIEEQDRWFNENFPGSRQDFPTAGPSNSTPSCVKDRRECVICNDTIYGHAPCGHFYDQHCLTNLFTSAVKDEAMYPPQCCQRPFVLAQVRSYLTPDLCTLFEKKGVEFGTADRVYCYGNECSAFLGPATSEPSNLLCVQCNRHTCARCKAATHSSLWICDPWLSREDKVVLDLAKQSGWVRCPKFRRLVDLAQGCYHMTCLCRAQFCYLCSAQWKTCTCPQWDESRLT